jgi:ribosomal-protein-alanine N-acetyltransferase
MVGGWLVLLLGDRLAQQKPKVVRGRGRKPMKPGTPPQEFETSRLRLRRPEPADAPTIFERWTQDPEVTRYLVWRPHETLAESEEHIANCIASWEAGSEFVWYLEERGSAKLVGALACRPNARGVNLGYLLARNSWGQGYMVEALAPVIEYWLAQPQVFRVWATCDVENRGSARVLEKAGLEFEGRLRRWEHHPNVGAEPQDALCYSKVRD